VPVFEVFGQEAAGGPIVYSGSVVAPDAEFAAQYARNSFARREEALRLWIVPRSAIHEVADADLLQPPGDHRYRMGRYYRANVDKRKRVKANVQEAAGAAS
jgi:ring-1,2-phenylacetyl-CoA epoxidase subunit PaaB